MNPEKRKQIENAGGSVVSIQNFLELTDTELAIIEIKLKLVKFGDYNNTILVHSDTIDTMVEKLINNGCSLKNITKQIYEAGN